MDARVLIVRDKISVLSDDTLRRDEAIAEMVCHGKVYTAHIAHATGTVKNPMSDAALQVKFLANAAPIIGDERAKQVIDLVFALDDLSDVRELINLCA